eukprot:gnl/TRDRNA2_/TRDRNA2_156475_c0_seq6.p1 gnl/TRDRNA2_/TRDRNA2_156475_c0~~gnl/TRDRNA2_/TRDRNA2_156475_c0_seq6.p1  ORF type:complete len:403 (+),score=78.42 gnl/TRDRNA2_/TRDRNA2_156475_c0_seq6:3-1211(+)
MDRTALQPHSIVEGLDDREASAVIDDLVTGDVVQWDMKVHDFELVEAQTWFGTVAQPTDVNGWHASRFDIRGNVGVVMKQKGNRRSSMTFQEYFGCPLPPNACLPEHRQEFISADEVRADSFSETWSDSGVSEWSELTETMNLPPRKYLQTDFIADDASDDESTISEAPWMDSAAAARCDSKSTSTSRGSRGFAVLSMPRPASGDLGPLPNPLARHRRSEASSGYRSSTPSSPAAASKREPWRKNFKPESADKQGRTAKRLSGSVWLATDFAISIGQFVPILDAFAAEHEAVRRLRDLLNSRGLEEAAKQARMAAESAAANAAANGAQGDVGHVFPVKVSVPLNVAIRGIMNMETFVVKEPGTLPEELFEVPSNYCRVPRHEAQKTLSRSKKRLLLAHLAMM